MIIERHHTEAQSPEEVFAINDVLVFDAFRDQYALLELAYFDLLPSLVFPQAEDRDRAKVLTEAARILYVSIKMHIVAMQYAHDAQDHALELAILYGDCLPGRYARLLIAAGELDMLREWLDRELVYFDEMTQMALDERPLAERMERFLQLVMSLLVEAAAREPESLGTLSRAPEVMTRLLTAAFLHGEWDELLESIRASAPLIEQVALLESWRDTPIDAAGLALRQQYFG